jgi:hypothetical protein
VTTEAVEANSPTSPLFNEAFCAVLAHAACRDFSLHGTEAMPLPYAYLILPLALHAPTREALPRTTAASMWPWVRDRAEIMAGLTHRIQAFRPYVSGALLFGVRSRVLIAAPDGLTAGVLRRRPRNLRPTVDWSECLRASAFLGRWFAAQRTDTASTLAIWGLRP